MDGGELERAGALLEGLCADLDGNFEPLVLAYQNRLYAFALRLSGNAQDAEEIAQDAFVRAYRALRGYDAERIRALALRPWLYQITLNVYRNRARQKRVAAAAMPDEVGENSGPEFAGDEREEPEARLARAESERDLGALVASLPGRYRAAVILRFVEELSYGEVATALSQPVGTVKANVHRGIAWLRRALPSSAMDLR